LKLHLHWLVMVRPGLAKGLRACIRHHAARALGVDTLRWPALKWEGKYHTLGLEGARAWLTYMLGVIVPKGQTIQGIEGSSEPRVSGRRFLHSPLAAVTRLPEVSKTTGRRTRSMSNKVLPEPIE